MNSGKRTFAPNFLFLFLFLLLFFSLHTGLTLKKTAPTKKKKNQGFYLNIFSPFERRVSVFFAVFVCFCFCLFCFCCLSGALRESRGLCGLPLLFGR